MQSGLDALGHGSVLFSPLEFAINWSGSEAQVRSPLGFGSGFPSLKRRELFRTTH